MANIISGPVCQCQHTHIYGGNAYIDCPYCDCHEHTKISADLVFNTKRFNSWVRKHNKRQRIEDIKIIW